MISYDKIEILFTDKKPGTYVLEIEYAYDWDFAPTISLEVCEWDGTNICWFNDWWEGQEQIYVENIYDIRDLVRVYTNRERC